MKDSLSSCPACASDLKVRSYRCPACELEIQGTFSGCSFCGLDDDDRYFALVFLQCEGNMKDAARVMGISYPTVKNRLGRIKSHLRKEGGEAREEPTVDTEERARIIEALDRGEIDYDEALRRLAEND